MKKFFTLTLLICYGLSSLTSVMANNDSLATLSWDDNVFNSVNESDGSLVAFSPQETPMGGESSTSNIQVRDFPDVVVIFGGLNAYFKKPKNPQETRMCTLGFAVKRSRGADRFDRGFLTSGACATEFPKRGEDNDHDAFVNRVNSSGDLEPVKIGTLTNPIYGPGAGLDYAIVKINPEHWDDNLSPTIIEAVKPYWVLDVGEPTEAVRGTRVCFFPEFSGEFSGGPICGTVENANYEAAVQDPWGRRYDGRWIGGRFGRVNYFSGMVKVKLEQIPYSQYNPQFSGIDTGAPVFVPVSRRGPLLAARPVGILQSFETNDLPYMIYQPIQWILNHADIELYKTPKQNDYLTKATSLKSAVNDSSVVLPVDKSADTLSGKFGEDASSRLDKRGEVSLYAGYPVTGISSASKGQLYQRDCSLSFPVADPNNKKGFLISFICATSNVFVGNDQAGLSTLYNGFNANQGLDYMFVQVFDEYWSDYISPNIPYNEYYINNRFDLLAVNGVARPPTGTSVCAYGGKSDLTCGQIAEFGVTIKTTTPGSNGDEVVDFYNVTKVLMDKNYAAGDLGAPVYIAARIPFSPQIVSNPVGQVIENVDQNHEVNAWYYIPIERILGDSKLTLLLGKPDDNLNGNY